MWSRELLSAEHNWQSYAVWLWTWTRLCLWEPGVVCGGHSKHLSGVELLQESLDIELDGQLCLAPVDIACRDMQRHMSARGHPPCTTPCPPGPD